MQSDHIDVLFDYMLCVLQLPSLSKEHGNIYFVNMCHAFPM
jgi:hypothetical protein